MKKFSHGDWTADARWIAKGKLIVSAGQDDVVRSWTTKGVLQHELKSPAYSACCGVLSSSIIAAFNGGDADLTLWDASSGKTVHRLAGHQKANRKNRAGANVSCAAMSFDGSMVVSGGFDNTIRFWDVKSGEELRNVVMPSLPWSVSFSPDGSLVAAGLFPHLVVVIDVKAGKKRAQTKASQKAVTSSLFTNDGQLVTGGGAGELKLWRLEGKKLTSRGMFGIPDGGGIEGVSLSPDATLLAAASRGGWIRVWDLESGNERKKLRRNVPFGGDVDFSPDGKQLMYAGPGAVGFVKVS
ncbi:MAG: WD40 repeat domain-containing protein [Archangium sp.]|nr:WD40 repeat domain-containing protein [Archangium sp.]